MRSLALLVVCAGLLFTSACASFQPAAVVADKDGGAWFAGEHAGKGALVYCPKPEGEGKEVKPCLRMPVESAEAK